VATVVKQRIGFKPSVREMQEASEKAQDFYALMSGKPRPEFKPLKPKQVRAKAGSSGIPLEQDVKMDIIRALCRHPAVAWVEKHNSGSAGDSYIKFHVIYLPTGKKIEVKKADIDFQLNNGRRVLVEVKRPGWKKPSNPREVAQSNYLDMARKARCIAMFSTSVEEVILAIESDFGLT
jgi:hypothetical protein